jgi:hypothetical protein
MDNRQAKLPYAVVSNWDFGQAEVEPFSTESEAHEYAASLPGESHIVEIIGYRADAEQELEHA